MPCRAYLLIEVRMERDEISKKMEDKKTGREAKNKLSYKT